MAPEKTVGPSTVLCFAGIELDTSAMEGFAKSRPAVQQPAAHGLPQPAAHHGLAAHGPRPTARDGLATWRPGGPVLIFNSFFVQW